MLGMRTPNGDETGAIGARGASGAVGNGVGVEAAPGAGPAIVPPSVPFGVGACDCTSGDAAGELPIVEGQGNAFGARDPPMASCPL